MAAEYRWTYRLEKGCVVVCCNGTYIATAPARTRWGAWWVARRIREAYLRDLHDTYGISGH